MNASQQKAAAILTALLGAVGAQSCQQKIELRLDASATALDGDTFSFRGAHYRLAEIDAPELPGHCRGWRARHHRCAAGDPWQAKAGLQQLLSLKPTCTALGHDYYQRELVRCHLPSGADLGQLLVQNHLAEGNRYEP